MTWFGCCTRPPAAAEPTALACAAPPTPSSPISISHTALLSESDSSRTQPLEELRRSFETAAAQLGLGRGGRGGGHSSHEPATLRHPEACPPCSSRPRPARLTTALALGADENGAKCVNQYVKRQKLASGSYGKVSLYRSRENGKLFAVKVLNKPQLERKRVSRSASALSDVFHEISLLRALDHPNIVRLEEVIDDANEPKIYVVMEYLSRGPVHSEGASPVSYEAAARALADAAAALAFCHWQGVAHGDVKPENMLVGGDGRVRLVDFSVSQLLGGGVEGEEARDGAAAAPPDGPQGAEARSGDAGERGSRSSRGSRRTSNDLARTPGTPAYTAPECCAGGSFSGVSADVWALGISLHTMLVGAPPFVGATLMETYERIRTGPLRLPAELEASEAGALLVRMLQKDPQRRASLDDVLSSPFVVRHCGAPPEQPVYS